MRIKHLLKTTALTALLLIGAKVGWGQALLEENFSYTAGTLLTANGWTAHSSGGTSAIAVDATGLSYPGYFSSNIGLSAKLVTSGEDDNKGFTSQNAGSVYMSFLIKVTAATTTGDYGIHYCQVNGSAASGFYNRIFVKKDASNNLAFGISKISSTVTYTGFNYSLNTTYLLVTKYTFNTGTTTDDVAELFVNPVLGSPEPTSTVSESSGTDATALTGICLRQGGASSAATANYDGIRVATSWADAVKVETTPPVTSFNPANSATGVELNSNIVISFDEAVRNLDGSAIADPTSLITLKETDAAGVDVPFTATINAGKTQITIDPTSNLGYNKAYYVAVAQVEDAVGNEQAAASNATFTTRAIYTTATVSSTTYTVTDGPTWTISMIAAGVDVAAFEGNLTPATGATFNTYLADGTTEATGAVINGDKVIVTAEDGSKNTYVLVVTPALTADIADNNVDNNIDITFDYDATWYAAILKVYVNTVELTAGTDYDFTTVTKVPGVNTLRLKPSATSNAVLQAAGTWNVKITATGYVDATLAQTVLAGAPTLANTTSAIGTALNLNVVTAITVTTKDQYLNPVKDYEFKAIGTVTRDDNTTDEMYKIGPTSMNTSFNVTLAKTDATGVATLAVEMPSSIDPGDGIDIQMTLNDGTTNLTDALYQYHSPLVPALSISATPAITETNLNGSNISLVVLNDTFVDDVLTQTNFTLNNAPTGVTISGVTYVDSKHATVALAYDGTDFDVNSTTVNVTVDASELTANGTLTSNNLTIAALVETAPVVTTAAAVTTNGEFTATWEGTITSDGGEAVTEKGICWGATADPTTADSKIADASVGTTITGNLTGLTANTLYHVRAYATNVEGTTYGEDRTFTTLLSSAKAIVSTTIGSVDETNKLVISVPATTTVADLKAALTVSPNATFEIYTAPAGTTVATGTTVLSTVKNYVIRVKAQDLTTQEYGIGLVYTETTIHDIQYTTDASGDSPKLNQIVKFKGIVTAIKGGSYQSAYVQDGVGAWSAVYAFSIPTTTTVAEGDSVSIEGFVKEYNKLTEIDPVYRVTVINQGNTLPEAAVITTQVAGSSEAYESVLIQVKWAKCTSITYNTATPPVATGGVLNDGSGDLTAYYSLYSGLTFTVNNRYNVTGVMTWFNTGSIYEIYPRRSSDVSDVTGINDNTLSNLTVYPNPFSNEIKIDATQNVKRIVISSITGQVVKNEIIVGTSVNTESLPKGMYLVTLFNDKGEKTTLKMIKQ